MSVSFARAGVVGVQAQELAEAETKKHVAEEAADVTYFMVRVAFFLVAINIIV